MWRGFVREFAKVRKEIEDLTQKVLKLCEECGVTPKYNADGTLNIEVMHADIFRVKSADLRGYLQNALKLSGLTQKMSIDTSGIIWVSIILANLNGRCQPQSNTRSCKKFYQR